MGRIEDMSEPQRQSWITILADGAVFIWFLRRMIDGGRIVDLPAGELMAVFIVAIGWTIVAHIVISIAFETRKRKSKVAKDERDADIGRHGDQTGYYLLSIFINVLIFTYLFRLVVGGDDYQPPLGLDLTLPSHMFFVLMSAVYIADIAKQGRKILLYRG